MSGKQGHYGQSLQTNENNQLAAIEKHSHQGCYALCAKNIEVKMKLGDFSRKSHRVEKIRLFKVPKNPKHAMVYWSILTTSESAIFRRFGNQQIFEAIAINVHHFEEAENKIRIKMKKLRRFESITSST